MNREEFKASLVHDEPPDGLSAPLLALWWDAKEDWSRAHALVDELELLCLGGCSKQPTGVSRAAIARTGRSYDGRTETSVLLRDIFCHMALWGVRRHS